MSLATREAVSINNMPGTRGNRTGRVLVGELSGNPTNQELPGAGKERPYLTIVMVTAADSTGFEISSPRASGNVARSAS